MIGPGIGHLDTEWMDEFMTYCDALNCRIDYVAGHLYKPSVCPILKLIAFA